MNGKSIKVNAILNAVRTLVNILFPLITFKYASQVLMATNLGKVNFSNSVVSYFVLLADFGIATYAVREGSKYRTEKVKFQAFTNEVFTINIIATILSYILIFIMTLLWGKIETYKWLVYIQSISIVFTAIGATWVNTIYEDYKSILLRSILVQVISLLLLFILVHDEDDYYLYALVSVLAQSGANIFNCIYIRKKYCKPKIKLSREMMRHVSSLIILFGISITTTIYVNSDTTMIGVFGTDDDVAYYSVAVKVYNIVKALLASIIIVMIPKLTELHINKKNKEYKFLAEKAEALLLTFMLPLICVLYILSREAIMLVSGEAYLDSVITLRLLCFAIFGSLIATYITDAIILPQGYEKGAFLSAGVSAVVNVGLNFCFIPIYGYNGAAITTVISETLVVIIDIIYVVKKDKTNMNLIFNKLSLNDFWKTCIGVLAFTLVDYIIIKNINSISLKIILVLGASGLIYAGVMLILRQQSFADGCKLIIKRLKHGGNNNV